MEVLSLNLIPTGTTPVVHVKQYDVGRTWRFNLKEGPIVYTLDGTETIECDIKKKDGNVVTVAVTNTSASYIDIETTLQMTACSGDNLGAIRLKKGSDDIGTLNFILSCERSPLENGIESESSIHNLEQQIADAVADQYDADSVIFDNTPTAAHGVGFAVTSEGLLSYIPKTVAALDDVTITTPVQGEALVFDIDGNFVNGTPSLDVDDLDDVTITTPTNGEILVYNNGSWENQANPASTANFAPDYDDTATYNTNDKVIYQGLMYVCLEDNITGAWDSTKWQNISVADYTAEMLPIESGSSTNTKAYIDSGLSGKADTSDTYTKTEVDAKVPKYFDLTVSSSVSDSGISPFSYYGQSTKTDSNIHNILSVTVIDTQFNNPAIAVLYGVSGSTYTFMVYSARSGNVKIRVVYK